VAHWACAHGLPAWFPELVRDSRLSASDEEVAADAVLLPMHPGARLAAACQAAAAVHAEVAIHPDVRQTVDLAAWSNAEGAVAQAGACPMSAALLERLGAAQQAPRVRQRVPVLGVLQQLAPVLVLPQRLEAAQEPMASQQPELLEPEWVRASELPQAPQQQAQVPRVSRRQADAPVLPASEEQVALQQEQAAAVPPLRPLLSRCALPLRRILDPPLPANALSLSRQHPRESNSNASSFQ